MKKLGPWSNSTSQPPKSFICGFCGKQVGSNTGYRAESGELGYNTYIFICPFCGHPSYFDGENQTPGVAYGVAVSHIPSNEVESLYNESRECMKVNAYTASVLCSRKLLMNIAVSKGAGEGKSFVDYVSYLESKGYLPPDSKEWVDHIRKTGNIATHKIRIMRREEAEELISFIEMLLKFIYEFPAMMKAKANPPNNTPTS